MKTSIIFFTIFLALCSAFPDRNQRIINGRDATPGEAPYMIQFQITGRTNPVWCGGALVSTTHIVSAAHCFTDDLMERFVFVAVAGQHNWRVDSGNEQIRSLREVTNHPNYDPRFFGFDINLIQVESPFVLNQWVQIIALPPRDFRHTGDVQIYGWGSTHPSQQVTPDILQTTTKHVLAPEVCSEIFSGIGGLNNAVHYTDLCAGPLDGSTDSCGGDSGGPLVQINPSTGNLELVAVVAWGSSPCATPNFPSVNTRTSPFVDDLLNLN